MRKKWEWQELSGDTCRKQPWTHAKEEKRKAEAPFLSRWTLCLQAVLVSGGSHPLFPEQVGEHLERDKSRRSRSSSVRSFKPRFEADSKIELVFAFFLVNNKLALPSLSFSSFKLKHQRGRISKSRSLTRLIWAEVDGEDVVTKAREVFQLPEVALQRHAGKVCFVQRGHKTKHKGIQTGGPFIKNIRKAKVFFVLKETLKLGWTSENSQVAKKVVSTSQSVGEEIQALFSIAVDLRQSRRHWNKNTETKTSQPQTTRRNLPFPPPQKSGATAPLLWLGGCERGRCWRGD